MKRFWPLLLSTLLLTLTYSDACLAQAGGGTNNHADDFSAAKSSEDYTGKRLEFPVEIKVKRKGDTSNAQICLPAHTPLRGMSKVTAGGLLVTVREDVGKRIAAPDNAAAHIKAHCDSSSVDVSTLLGEALVVSKDDIETYHANVSGLSYGLLFVPFKYHLNGSRDFKGSGSIGPYAGYKTESSNWGASIEIVGFAGLTSVSVERNVDGKATTDNITGFSYGIGAIGRIRDNFQIGVVLGSDRVGNKVGYPDNGKIWIAVSAGYAFSN